MVESSEGSVAGFALYCREDHGVDVVPQELPLGNDPPALPVGVQDRLEKTLEFLRECAQIHVQGCAHVV